MLYDISLWKLRQRLHYVYWNDVIVMIYAPNFDYVAYIAVRHDMIWLRNLRRSLKNWPAAGQDIDAQIPVPIKWKNKLRLIGINECSTNWEMQPIRTFNIAFCIICILLSERDYVTFGSLLSQIRLSSVCNFGTIFLHRCVPWPSSDLRAKFYRDRLRATLRRGVKCKRGIKIDRCWTYRRLYLINDTR